MQIKNLTPNSRNPRRISDKKLEALSRSMDKYGDLGGIVFNRRSGKLIGAHQRSKGMPPDSNIIITQNWATPTKCFTVAEGYVELDGERFKYREVDADDEWEVGAMLAANASGGEWENSILKVTLAEFPAIDRELLGFSPIELKKFGVEPTPSQLEEQKVNEEKENEIPETPQVPRTKLGDLFQLGEHRLLCGDSTDVASVSRLMNGEKADMVFTDPPYNLASDSKLLAARGLRDSYDKLKESKWDHNFNFADTFPMFEMVLGDNSTIYICTSHFLFGSIQEWLTKWADLTNFITWAKPNPMPSLTKRHWTWASELICYGTKGKHVFNFPSEGHALDVWTINKNQSNDLHPTMKPVAVPEHAVLHSSNPGQLVVDLFLGSGSTLIACEKTGRKCYGMEIDPHYCDIIIARWEKFTGGIAVLKSS